jgi:chromosomal replication initiator protein
MTYFSAPVIIEKMMDINYIQKIVCEYYHISVKDIQNPTRKHEILRPRQISMYFAKNIIKSSLSTIGYHIGNKDNATVIHACQIVNNLIETDKQFRAQIEEIERRIKA